MSIKIMSAVWEMTLPAFEKLVLLALADCANDEGLCWPSIATLKSKSGAGERTVQRAIKSLEADGILTRRQVPGKGCKYRIHPRHIDTPVRTAPVTVRREPPPERHPTPVCVAPKPSMNRKEPSDNSSPDDEPLSVQDIWEGWNELAEQCGLPKAAKLTPERKRRVQARLKEWPDIEDWRKAFRHIRNTPFLCGKNDRGWRANFKFLLQPESFASLVEETYGQTN